MKPVEGPKGPHLFRASQTSVDFDFEFALQMSPLLPKQIQLDVRVDAATPATVIAPNQFSSLTGAMHQVDPSEVRTWSARQVGSWMYGLGFEELVIEKFEAHDITGAVLLDMQFEDLRELDIPSFGKRHQLWAHIESLRENDGRVSPVPTPFQDISRPATRNTRGDQPRERSKSRQRKRDKSRNKDCEEDGMTPITPGGGKKKKNRKQHKQDEPIMPGESVSIVAIEQLMPKPHKCAKGERCAKWRKQQRLIQRLQNEHGIGVGVPFPISPEKGGHIFVAGDPGNAMMANKLVDNVRRLNVPDTDHRPTSDNVASVVASSAALPSATLPQFSLQEEMLQHIEQRDPQENVKQFLSLQGLDITEVYQSPVDRPATPPMELFPPHHPPELKHSPHSRLNSLPKLTIPRCASAQPGQQFVIPVSAWSASSPCQTACQTAITPSMSPGGWNNSNVYRFGTPCSEMDVPVTAIPLGPVSRDTSQSVPPNMQYRQQRVLSGIPEHADWRRPSFALPALQEGEVYSAVPQAAEDDTRSVKSEGTLLGETAVGNFDGAKQEILSPQSASSSPGATTSAKPLEVIGHDLRPPSNVSSTSLHHYTGVSHSGWMKKRHTKLLRHEWKDHHFRLNGTMLSQHANALPSSSTLATIDVDDYAVACSSIASSKLSAKLKSLKIVNGQANTPADAAFSFQLVPCAEAADGERRKKVAGTKPHHFAVKTRDERIDWMRELMLAKALKAKGEGYEVQVNGNAV
jgi:hypothetical protein